MKKLFPCVTFDSLNNVPSYARWYTYGFFDTSPGHQKSYERFQAVYPNAVWYANAPHLRLADIQDLVLHIAGCNSDG